MLATPEPRVLCSGLHALCSLASCALTGDCACVMANGTHVVALAEIRNAGIQAATAARCTSATPCALNEAPVCSAVASGATFGDQPTEPGMVSTFSWDGWCDAAAAIHAVCPASPWAACMTAPCTRDGDLVSCRCTMSNSSWLDLTGAGCARVASSVPSDFDLRVLPGADYVLGACAEVWPP